MFERIIFLQGDNANYAINLLEEQGQEIVMEYLKEWHYPEEHETSNELGHGSSDYVYEKDNYILTYNLGLNYIGLEYRK